MKLFWSPRTRASRAVWMLEELGLDYDCEQIDIRLQDSKNAEFLAASPMGKVPALVDGEVAVAESGALCLYLVDRYSSGQLAPALDDPVRGKFLYWMYYTPAVIEPAMAEKFAGAATNRVQNGWGDFATMIATWEAALDGCDWLVNDRFSAADVMVGSSAVFMQLFNILPESPVLQRYAERCLSRPAYQRAMAREPAPEA